MFLSFRYISGSYPGAKQGANFSIALLPVPVNDTVAQNLISQPRDERRRQTPPACIVDKPPITPVPPAPMPHAVATLWRSPHYEDWRFCEGSRDLGVKGPHTCPQYPGDIEHYSPPITADVRLAVPVEASTPLRVAIVCDNNGRDLLIDLDSLRLELDFGIAS